MYRGMGRGKLLQAALIEHVGGENKNVASLCNGTFKSTGTVTMIVTSYATAARDCGVLKKGAKKVASGQDKGKGKAKGKGKGKGKSRSEEELEARLRIRDLRFGVIIFDEVSECLNCMFPMILFYLIEYS